MTSGGPGVDPDVAAARNRLKAIVVARPELAEMAGYWDAAIPLLKGAFDQVEPLDLAPGVAEQKLAAGSPVLVGLDLPLDVALSRRLFIQLCQLIERGHGSGDARPSPRRAGLFRRGKPDPERVFEKARAGDDDAIRRAVAGQIRRAVEGGQIDLPGAWAALASGEWRRFEIAASGLSLDPDMLRMLVQNSLKPSLRRWAGAITADTSAWQRGACPACGAAPTLAEITGKDGERRLRCGMCGSGWRLRRLECAFCGNDNHTLLKRITVEGEDQKYFAQACDVCHGYLKVVNSFESIPVDQLPVEDLATVHLDLIALEHEYERVPVR